MLFLNCSRGVPSTVRSTLYHAFTQTASKNVDCSRLGMRTHDERRVSTSRNPFYCLQGATSKSQDTWAVLSLKQMARHFEYPSIGLPQSCVGVHQVQARPIPSSRMSERREDNETIERYFASLPSPLALHLQPIQLQSPRGRHDSHQTVQPGPVIFALTPICAPKAPKPRCSFFFSDLPFIPRVHRGLGGAMCHLLIASI